MSSGSDDNDGKPRLSDLDRTTRILAQLESQISRSRRELAALWCNLDDVQQRRTTPEGLTAPDAGRRRVTPDGLPAVTPGTGSNRGPAADRSADVLVVEDDRDLATALTDLLVEQGYRVVTVHTGQAALAYLSDVGRPAAIVLDLMMPDTSGGAVIEGLRALQDPAPPEVIIFTAASTEYIRGAGIDPETVVRKPYLPVLLDRLSRIGADALRRAPRTR
jgi:CheY-like chemotaxis protein